MNRKAVLIESSNVNGQQELPGASIDIQNWKNFLKSDLGGAWNDSEIVVFNKPLSSVLENALKVAADCYCFVAFSGHGCDGSIVLNDYFGSYPVSKLRPEIEKATVVVDACRGVEKAEHFSFNRKISMANELDGVLTAKAALFEKCSTRTFSSKELMYNRTEKIKGHRARWGTALTESSKGIVEMLACAKGQSADEDPSAGGYYTSLLLQSAERWNSITTGNVHTTKDAHDYAASLLPPQQTPEYRPLWLAFPFAVRE